MLHGRFSSAAAPIVAVPRLARISPRKHYRTLYRAPSQDEAEHTESAGRAWESNNE
jgi:hypothetical protein